MSYTQYDSLGNNVSKEIRDIDAKGYFRGHTFYRDGKLEWKCIHKLNDRGKQIQDTRTSFDGSVIYVRKFKYDTNGNMLESQTFNEEGDLSEQYNVKYSDKGIKIEVANVFIYWSTYNNQEVKAPILSGLSLYSYDVEGNLQSSLSEVGDAGYCISKYDKKGNCVEEKWLYSYAGSGCDSPDVDVRKKNNIDYIIKDEKKDITNMINNEFHEKIEHIYTFDQYGNWLTKTTYTQKQNTLPTCAEIIEREIEYYRN